VSNIGGKNRGQWKGGSSHSRTRTIFSQFLLFTHLHPPLQGGSIEMSESICEIKGAPEVIPLLHPPNFNFFFCFDKQTSQFLLIMHILSLFNFLVRSRCRWPMIGTGLIKGGRLNGPSRIIKHDGTMSFIFATVFHFSCVL
jgi:hypothetical protein